MGAASAFIKEGIRHISAVQRKEGTLRGSEWHGDSSVSWRSVWLLRTRRHLRAVTVFVCQSAMGQMFRRIHALSDLNSSSLVVSWSRRLCLINTQHLLADEVKGSTQILVWFPRESSSSCFVPPPHFFIQVFIFLLQPAYRLLYYSWTPYCFSWMQKACFLSHNTSSTAHAVVSTASCTVWEGWTSGLLWVAAFTVYSLPSV